MALPTRALVAVRTVNNVWWAFVPDIARLGSAGWNRVDAGNRSWCSTWKILIDDLSVVPLV
jgi:hypothetical protein